MPVWQFDLRRLKTAAGPDERVSDDGRLDHLRLGNRRGGDDAVGLAFCQPDRAGGGGVGDPVAGLARRVD